MVSRILHVRFEDAHNQCCEETFYLFVSVRDCCYRGWDLVTSKCRPGSATDYEYVISTLSINLSLFVCYVICPMDSHCVYTDSGGHGPNDLDSSHELHACACPGCLGVFVVRVAIGGMSMVSFKGE